MTEFPDILGDLPQADIPFDGISARLLQGKNHQVICFDQADRYRAVSGK